MSKYKNRPCKIYMSDGSVYSWHESDSVYNKFIECKTIWLYYYNGDVKDEYMLNRDHVVRIVIEGEK